MQADQRQHHVIGKKTFNCATSNAAISQCSHFAAAVQPSVLAISLVLHWNKQRLYELQR
jgi:hypothetical protein